MKAPEQMELIKEAPSTDTLPRRRRHRKMQRASWWFNRMRQEVGKAREWEPAPIPRSEPPFLVVPSCNLAPQGRGTGHHTESF